MNNLVDNSFKMDSNESLSSSFQEMKEMKEMKEMMIKSLNSINETIRGHNENFRVIIAKMDLYLEKCAKPIEIVKVDKGSFNFPISSLTKLEGVGKLKLPESILLTLNFVDPDTFTSKEEISEKPSPELPPISTALIAPEKFVVLSPVQKKAFSPTISYVLMEKAKEKDFCRNLMDFLFFYYE